MLPNANLVSEVSNQYSLNLSINLYRVIWRLITVVLVYTPYTAPGQLRLAHGACQVFSRAIQGLPS